MVDKQKYTPVQSEIEQVDGAAIAAKILRRYPIAERARLLTAMTEQAPELALKVQDKMYNIEELRSLTNQGTQTLVREVPRHDLVLAVAGASIEVRNKLLTGMSERSQVNFKEEADQISNSIQPSQVKAAQWRLMQKLDELRERGAVVTVEKTGTWA